MLVPDGPAPVPDDTWGHLSISPPRTSTSLPASGPSPGTRCTPDGVYDQDHVHAAQDLDLDDPRLQSDGPFRNLAIQLLDVTPGLLFDRHVAVVQVGRIDGCLESFDANPGRLGGPSAASWLEFARGQQSTLEEPVGRLRRRPDAQDNVLRRRGGVVGAPSDLDPPFLEWATGMPSGGESPQPDR